MQNQTINNFKLLSKLGEGGMAEVWYAENRIGKKAAIKIIKKELSLLSEIVSRFENEARVMVTLNHPNIRQVYDYSLIDGRPCIIMEYLEGADLSDRLKKGDRFSNEQLADWWNQLTEALNYTHKKEIVHRDIKPSNIFLTDDEKIKLLDFGIAKVKGGLSNTQTGTRMGTLLYMSPEQVKDSKYVDYRTDIYSLAVTFYHLLSGKEPYDSTKSSEWEIQVKIVNEQLNLYNINDEWLNILEPYLDKDPQRRPELSSLNTIQRIPKRNEQQLFVQQSWSEADTQIIIKTEEGPLKNHLAIEWVNIPAGTFMMGSPMSEKERGEDETQHQVTLSAFRMSKHEVTFDQYDAFCAATGRSKPSDSGWGRGKRPVINVNWHDAKAFADWICCRLPTEAEWEYACRAGTSIPFNTGSSLNTSQANYDGNYPHINSKGEYRQKTLSVGSFAPNEWGLYDMHGNVFEWCSDWHAAYPTEAQTNPKGPATGSYLVLRGGSWASNAICCRSAYRRNYTPASRSFNIGFRLVSP